MMFFLALLFAPAALAGVEVDFSLFTNWEDAAQARLVARGSSAVNAGQWGYAVDVWGGSVQLGVAGSCYLGAHVRGYTAQPGTIQAASKGFAAATGVALAGSPPWSWAAIWDTQATAQANSGGGLNVSAQAAGAVVASIWASLEEVDCGANSNSDTATVYQQFNLSQGVWLLNNAASKTTGTGAKWCTFSGAGVPLTPFAGLRIGYVAGVTQEPHLFPRFNAYSKKRSVKKMLYLRNFPYLDTTRCLRTTFYTAGAAAAVTVSAATGPTWTQPDGLEVKYEANFITRADGGAVETAAAWEIGAWQTADPQDPLIPLDARNFFSSKYAAGVAVKKLRLSTKTGGRCGATELCLYDPSEGSSPTDDTTTSATFSSASLASLSVLLALLVAVLL